MPYDDISEVKKNKSYDGEDIGAYWHRELEEAKKVFDKWETRGKKVVRRYRDERDAVEWPRTKFNILWSNYQVLFPSLYGRKPKPEVSRRYMDSDPVGRLGCTMLERVLEYETEQFNDFDSALRSVVEDRLLPGRGTAWVRFDPTIESQEASPEDSFETDAAQNELTITNVQEEYVERITEAHSPIDYVYWQDFMHSPARTWEEVWWVSRWVYMTKNEGIERFGNVFKNVSLNSQNVDNDSKNSIEAKTAYDKKAKVAEIWNKRTGKVCWIAEGYPQSLDERDDPLKLEEFFPCPKPLLSTTTNGSLIPVPDYCEYEDQALELDSITNRISMLVKAVKAVGVFNAEYKELGRLFTEGIDNKMFPVVSWAALSEKGGLKGAIDMMDLTTVLTALNQLYQARESVKQTIYEICGISDILRGTSSAEETLGAQQIKAQFGSLRLKSSQSEVARFASDLFRIKAQIICQFYPEQLIVEMSGIMNTPEGQDQKMVMAALQLLKNSTMRDFHISVESDSLAQIDELSERQGAQEAIVAISSFLQQAVPMVSQAPETLPMVSEMLLFLVRRFRAGRGLESSIERAMQALSDKAEQAKQNPQPDPKQQIAQMEAQGKQAELQLKGQIEQQKIQSDMEIEKMRLQQQQIVADNQAKLQMSMAGQEEQLERWKADLEARTKIMVAEIAAKALMDRTAQETERTNMKMMLESQNQVVA